MITILSDTKSIANHYLAQLRDINIQKDRMRFRRNIERLGEILAFEISKELRYSNKKIKTPLGIKEIHLSNDNIVIGCILRASIPFHQGFLNYFDNADNAFISAYRKKTTGNQFKIAIEYLASPNLTNKTLILVDPMLATGQSMHLSYQAAIKNGIPKKTHIASIIASSQAINYIKKKFKNVDYDLWTADLDKDIDNRSYIIPGLGDAGDLAFGEKL